MLSQGAGTKTIVIGEGRELRDVDFLLRVGGSISGKVTLKRSHLTIDQYRILVMRMNDPFYEFYKIQDNSYTAAGLQSGRYLVILVELQEPMTLEKLFAGPRWYDSKIVDVKRGVETINVDFIIDETQPVSLP